MSYDILDQSSQDGNPVYKFLFINNSVEYRFTSASYFISDSNGTWTPAPIQASSVQQTNEIAKNGVKITLPRTNTVAQLFLGKTPEEATSLTIYREHTEDDQRVYWRGRVASSETSGDSVTLSCEDIFTSMNRTGNRARYQKGCRHALYSQQCGVVDSSYETAVTLTASSGFSVTVSGAKDSNGDIVEAGYFVGGVIELADGSRRYILEQSGETLTLLSPFNDLTIGGGLSAVMYPGCKHSVSDCLNKFDNLNNYGGFPYIPGKNPFASSVNGSIA